MMSKLRIWLVRKLKPSWVSWRWFEATENKTTENKN